MGLGICPAIITILLYLFLIIERVAKDRKKLLNAMSKLVQASPYECAPVSLHWLRSSILNMP